MIRRITFLNVILPMTFCLLVSGGVANAQTTSFTYQGRLQDGGTNASGSYDFQFTLWDALSAGTQQPQPSPVTVTRTSVAVANGIFTVQLDFGASAFPGADRFLETNVRTTGAASFTLLSPRQPITSTPYAIRTLSATSADGLSGACVACVQDSQINSVAGSKITGAIPIGSVPSGSRNYIQNSTVQQSGDFNITGDGTAGGTLTGNSINSITQYKIGGSIVLSVSGGPGGSLVPNTNTFTGIGAGALTIPNGFANFNSFFGHGAGQSNVSGKGNSYFGYGADGGSAGINNTAIGFGANVANGLSNATVIGAGADVAASNSLVLGNGANVGIGTDAPLSRLHVVGNSIFATNGTNGVRITPVNDSDIGVLNVTNAANSVNWLTVGSNGQVIMNGPGRVGIGTTSPTARLQTEGSGLDSIYAHSVSGIGLHARSEQTWAGYFEGFVFFSRGITLSELASGGSGNPVCRNSSNELSNCSSSLRYKRDIHSFGGGLDIVNRLRPISFTWKQDGTKDIGFGAEEVEKVAPLFTFRNNKGEIEGVRYDRLSVVFVNAFKEQQAEIELQHQQIEALRKLVCRAHPRAKACQ